jgi:hypothetical protein
MAECSNESEGSATLEGDLHENEVEKETCESGGSSLIPSKLLSKLQEIKSDFTFNWRDHDELIVRVNELSKENQSLLEKLNSKDALIAARDENILMQQRENNQLREQLRQSYVSKDELIKIGNEKILTMELQFKDHLSLMQERLSLEQEDALAHLASVAEVQQAWQAALSQEAQTEIVRLRVELAKSRRQEAQREREVAYLQRQLTEAAKQLAQYVVESEEAEHSNE